MSEKDFRSGYVSIIGRPNVGKSTLMNLILNEKIAIVSKKPQTTRNRIIGIKHLHGAQIIFLDTPGIHKPKFAMNRKMVKTAMEALTEGDLVLFMVEATSPPGGGDHFIMEELKKVEKPIFLLINKVDLVKKDSLLPLIDEYSRFLNFKEIIPVSALNGDNVDHLIEIMVRYLPVGEPYYPEEMVTDQTVRFMAAEIIREKIFEKTMEEIPYSVAILIEEFKEKNEKGITRIKALILVEKDSQKGIIIGKSGEMLKAVGTEARRDLEELVGSKVFLDLWVKVKKDWRQDERILTEMGL